MPLLPASAEVHPVAHFASPASPSQLQAEAPFDSVRLVPGDDLPGTQVLGVTETSDGFMWFATDDGLARWDGSHATVIRASNTGGLPNSVVTSVAADPRSGVWIAAGKLVYVSPDTLTTKTFDIAAEQLAISGDDLWVLTRSAVSRLSLRDRSVAFTHPTKAMRDDGIETPMATNSSGELFVGNDRGITRFRRDGHAEEVTIGKGVLGLAISADGTLQAVSETRLWRIPPEFRRPREIADVPDANEGERPTVAAIEPSTGALVVGTTLGQVLAFHGEGWKPFRGLVSGNSYAAGGAIGQITFDADGGIWVTSAQWGARRIGPTRQAVWTVQRGGLAGPVNVTDLALGDDGHTIWLATDGAGLERFDARTTTWVTEPAFDTSIPSTSLSTVSVHGRQAWVGGLGVVGRVNLDTGDFSSVNTVAGPNVEKIRVDSDGAAWAAVAGFGVQVFDAGGRPIDTFAAGSIVNRTPFAIEHTGDSTWIGGREGLDRIRRTEGRVESWLQTSLKNIGSIHDIEVVSSSELWLASDAGLVEFNPISGEVRVLPSASTIGPARLHGVGLVPDSTVLWAATKDGLVMTDRVSHEHIAEFGPSSGIGAGNHLGPGKLTVGPTTFIGSDLGVVVVDKEARQVPEPHQIRITGVAVDSKRVVTERMIELSTDDRNIDFEFSEFAAPGGPHALLEYRMAGFDSGWTRAGESIRSARYSNLPAGSLRFEVRSTTSRATAGNQASIAVEVTGPWWAQPWSVLAAALGVGGFFILIATRRDRQARRRHQELEYLVAERTAELKSAAVEIEAVSESKSRLLSAISHDLRTPLTSILGYSELISASPDLNSTTARWADNARGAALHLSSLIDELAEMARFEALAVKLEVAPVDIAELLAHTIDLCTVASASEDGRKVGSMRVIVDPKVKASYRTDAVKLTRALVNLVSNALYHGEGSEVELAVSLAGTPAEGVDTLRFSVTDHGPGIPADKLDTIFEPFERLQGYDRNRLGLGLSIARQIVQRFGGTLEVTSTPSVATTFSFEIDVSVTPTIDNSRPLRVLVVEDNSSVRQVFDDQLAVVGAHAVVVGGGDDAIAELSAGTFDCVLVDHHLDGELGAEVAERIVEMPGYESTPIICVTANPAEAQRYAAYSQVLAKPVRVENLRQLVAELSQGILGGNRS